MRKNCAQCALCNPTVSSRCCAECLSGPDGGSNFVHVSCILCGRDRGSDYCRTCIDYSGFVPKQKAKTVSNYIAPETVKDILDSLNRANRIKTLYTRPVNYAANPGEIRNVIFNDPATIVFWEDGTKTVVKCQEGDTFDPEKGLAMAIVKKTYGNKSNYCNRIKKWTEKYEEQEMDRSLFDEAMLYYAYRLNSKLGHTEKENKDD